MEEKITYIFGAGASAKALPLARVLKDKDGELLIEGLAMQLKSLDFTFLESFSRMEPSHSKQNKSKIFREIAEKADEFGDVDTYAKYLHLIDPGGKELQKLKQVVSEYFILKQTIKNARDPRYLPWLVSIMDKKQFPRNVKILNWNYDYQIELAAAKIEDLEQISHHNSGFTYIPNFLNCLPNLDPNFSEFANLSLIHLNGTAGFVKDGSDVMESAFENKFDNSNEKLVSFINSKDLHSQLHFAWEGNNHHKSLEFFIDQMIIDTTILVIIGYSFPFFNRKVDGEIFKILKRSSRLKKIYYQDPKLTGQQLKSQFDLPEDFDIKHISDVNNFHIPFEY